MATKKTPNSAATTVAGTRRGTKNQRAPQAKAAVSSKKPPAAMDDTRSLIGKTAPNFTLLDQDETPVSAATLRGKPYVLYFYPKDNTPGCTTQACSFRDELTQFNKRGVTVFGVSPDSPRTHAGFAAKHELPFRLLSDPDKKLAIAYGVWAMKSNYGRQYMGIVRSTFFIDATGKVKKEWRNVKVAGHVKQVLDEVSS